MNPILARYNAGLPFSLQERDIDLLLIEQLHVCRPFADWLTGRLSLSGAVVETARHSVHREHCQNRGRTCRRNDRRQNWRPDAT